VRLGGGEGGENELGLDGGGGEEGLGWWGGESGGGESMGRGGGEGDRLGFLEEDGEEGRGEGERLEERGGEGEISERGRALRMPLPYVFSASSSASFSTPCCLSEK
jgi:hypothetical protein